MKFTATTLALAGVASASYGYPRHFHHFRRDNATASVDPMTTLTVVATEVRTVTSCAPTVTNCPAANNTAAISALPSGALTTGVVTDIVYLTTTVCPATAAASIASSVVDAHSSGLIPGKTVTPETAYPTGLVVKPTDVVTKATLTYTLGPSGSQTVVTTTLTSTIKSQVTVTVPKPTGGKDDSTTTSTLTSTGTRTVVVKPASTSGNSAGAGSNNNNNGEPGNCPAAVTVTAPAETVYITVTATPAQATGKVVNNGGSKQVDPSTSDEEGDGSDDECPPEDPQDPEVVTASVTATVVPYPTGVNNGTAPAPTGGVKFRRTHHY